jgi:hypothetical protein
MVPCIQTWGDYRSVDVYHRSWSHGLELVLRVTNVSTRHHIEKRILDSSPDYPAKGYGKIYFNGTNQTDFFVNDAGIPSVAKGHGGHDYLFGGLQRK